MDFQTARKAMVDSQVRVNDVTDRSLQAALMTVPRETLCAPDRAFSAYADVEVPVTATRQLMLPRDLSKLLMAAAPKPLERALVMAGAYAAAVLAEMGLDVTLQDSDAAALALSKPTLETAGVTMVEAALDRPQGEGWDLIVSETAVPVRPDAWLDTLKVGGRAVLVERAGPVGKAMLHVRTEDGWSRRQLFDATPPVLEELRPEPAFSL
jgi:protein-L-isoaspartate(D-aspartate) O-methyltransferase